MFRKRTGILPLLQALLFQHRIHKDSGRLKNLLSRNNCLRIMRIKMFVGTTIKVRIVLSSWIRAFPTFHPRPSIVSKKRWFLCVLPQWYSLAKKHEVILTIAREVVSSNFSYWQCNEHALGKP